MAYWARKVNLDGHTFDSQSEAARYVDLLAMQAAGEISELVVHPGWTLAPGVRIRGEKRMRPGMRFTADFSYRDRDGTPRVEDVKPENGHMTPAFRMRQHLVKWLHNIDVEVVKVGRPKGRKR